MEVIRAVQDAENALRDFVSQSLERKYGKEWYEAIRVSEKELALWETRKIPQELSHNRIQGKEKLIQYCTLNELRDLLRENWIAELQTTFGDFEILNTYLKIIEEFRNPDFKRRELFVFQKHLLLGISGEIRNKIAIARSEDEFGIEGFPRIESVRDNFGNLWVFGKPKKIKTNQILHVGAHLEYIVTAFDPQGNDLNYRLQGGKWTKNHVLISSISEAQIGKERSFQIAIKSDRKYHAYPLGYDDRIVFTYQVIP